MPTHATLCAHCGALILDYPSKKRRFCNRVCKEAAQTKTQVTRRNGRVYLRRPDHPRASLGWVKRAIIVLEEAGVVVGALDVHHRNGVKDDDRAENLVALTRAEHMRIHALAIGLGTTRCSRWPQHHSGE
jgi:hypothetical protein